MTRMDDLGPVERILAKALSYVLVAGFFLGTLYVMAWTIRDLTH